MYHFIGQDRTMEDRRFTLN